ncbi:MAG: DUF362 domain-containing protein, partial [Candidatus Sulfotelmatobacter sp.]
QSPKPLAGGLSRNGNDLERLVVLARAVRPDYGLLSDPVPAPELPGGKAHTVALAAMRELFRVWGLDAEHFGSAAWNPLEKFVCADSRVVLKPNWVLHWNKSGAGMDCMVTHAAVIEAGLEYLALAHPGSVVVGDAPVQGCNFGELRRICEIDAIVGRFRSRGMDVDIRDFRRTVLPGGKMGAARIEGNRGLEHFVLFDLKRESLLEPLAPQAEKFRVTMYNPDLMHRTHSPGHHEYMIAREIIEADTILNLPKLKTHKKACVTGALKNLVGINGHKEYLPHHRKGGGASGGDCYEGASRLKSGAETLLDTANRLDPGQLQVLVSKLAYMMSRLAVAVGYDRNMEGSWYGNDTIWRTCLDLHRITRYGRLDGTLADEPQRQVISITDGLIAGEGEGPMQPTPVPSGYLTGSVNPAAAEWVHARLMGFDPKKIPLIREAFSNFSQALADYPPSEIHLRSKEADLSEEEIFPIGGRAFMPAEGWKGHCELDAAETQGVR